MNNDLISRKALKNTLNEIFDTVNVVAFDDIIAVINNAPTVWHPFTEEPNEEGQYLVQHYYKTWSGKNTISYEVVDSLEELIGLISINDKDGNRDNHYQAWQKIEPYEEEENE